MLVQTRTITMRISLIPENSDSEETDSHKGEKGAGHGGGTGRGI